VRGRTNGLSEEESSGIEQIVREKIIRKKQIIWRDKREIVERKNNWFETGETYVRKKD
jgi:hypothetical protein